MHALCCLLLIKSNDATFWLQLCFPSLDWNPLGSAGLALLLTALIGKDSLQVLQLCSCRLTVHSATPLAVAIRTWPSLEELSISDNYLGVHGMDTIADAVADCQKFKTLK